MLSMNLPYLLKLLKCLLIYLNEHNSVSDVRIVHIKIIIVHKDELGSDEREKITQGASREINLLKYEFLNMYETNILWYTSRYRRILQRKPSC